MNRSPPHREMLYLLARRALRDWIDGDENWRVRFYYLLTVGARGDGAPYERGSDGRRRLGRFHQKSCLASVRAHLSVPGQRKQARDDIAPLFYIPCSTRYWRPFV